MTDRNQEMPQILTDVAIDSWAEGIARATAHNSPVAVHIAREAAKFVRAAIVPPGYCVVQLPSVAQSAPLTLDEIIGLALKAKLGRRMRPIGSIRHSDVFYTDASYRTAELEQFARLILERVGHAGIKGDRHD